MANGGGTDLLGLYLDLKRRRDQQQQFQQQFEMQQNSLVDRGFREAVEMAATGDKKLALSHLAISTRDRDTPEMRDYISQLAQHAKQQQKAAEEKAALPKGAEQTDVAQGVAGLLSRGGDPRVNALDALRSIPDAYPPELTNRLAMRGGAIAADRTARADRNVALMEKQSEITEARQLRREGRKAAEKKADGGKSKDRSAIDAAWETFMSAGVPFDEWRQDPSIPASVKANAIKHPGYIEMLRQRKKNTQGDVRVPYRLPEEAATSGEVKTPYGVLREKK